MCSFPIQGASHHIKQIKVFIGMDCAVDGVGEMGIAPGPIVPGFILEETFTGYGVKEDSLLYKQRENTDKRHSLFYAGRLSRH